jgi:D-3-phosphoglycerate dehydrogenase
VTDGLAEAGSAQLRPDAEIIDDPRALGSVDAWIVRSRTRVDAPALDRAAPRLRVIGRAGVGTDNIDLAAARRSGVAVVNAPEAGTIAVAELTLGLMLCLARQIPAAEAAVRRGQWPKGELVGSELHGKTLGLVGLGRIGREVARLAAAFGMRRIAFDPYLTDDAVRSGGAEPMELEALLAASDFLSLHLPLTEATRGMFSAEVLARCKPGARLICAARGGLIDEAALLNALDDGRLAGAALDVFEREPPGESRLVQHPRLVLTPHLGAQTVEAQERVAVEIAGEVLTVLRGGAPRWRVV